MEIANILKEFRLKNKMTQSELVNKLNRYAVFRSLTAISYHRWETGKVVPPVKKQAKLLMILDCKDELIKLCRLCQRDKNSLELTLKRRWDVRKFGFDFCYDNALSDDIEYSEVPNVYELPEAVVELQRSIYSNHEKGVEIDIERLLYDCKDTRFTIAQHNNMILGQLGFHTIKADALASYFRAMKYKEVNEISSLVHPDEMVVFISSFHSSRKDVYITFMKNVIETIFSLKSIPEYTYLRLHGNITNALISSQLEPTVITLGGKLAPRVKYISTEYEWIGYMVPTHLILLGYGSLLSVTDSIS